MKILAVEWRSAVDTVGIVLVENDAGQQSARIGVCKKEVVLDIVAQEIRVPVHNSEEQDKQYIADHGAKLTFPEAKGFFPWIKEENYKFS